ncbi:hypothetical protein ATK36_0579 [Amycolatopsis sulphurea]|uniref:Uncharacterized protein n=1 Tax=Amycolatopsis sulphurea TaxID=76022 RepID=A0A2A9G1J6_9PSEU|nr:hypothetical protein [Amycolatopsis sulphurea]PFG57033.1 hypothetical protein ATK36_0579 [Amycolatopsis sulphurea]
MADGPARYRKFLLVAGSAVVGALLGRLVTARPRAVPGRRVAQAEDARAQPEKAPPAVPERRPSRGSSVVYCVLVPLLLALAVWLMSRELRTAAEIPATAAVAVLALAFRGPVPRRSRWTVVVLVALAVVAVPFDQLLILSRIDTSVSDVGGLLIQVGLFIVFVGVLAGLAASWGKVVLAEVGALMLIAMLLGLVSFSGLSYFTAPVSAPEPDDAVLRVFAADPAAEMTVSVQYFPQDPGGSTLLSLQVISTGSADHRWGIALSGGLRFAPGNGHRAGVTRVDSAGGYQVLSGTQGTADFYNGTVVGSFQQSSASRSVVSLPPVSSDPFRLKGIDIRSATGFAAVRPRALTVHVDSGTLSPLETVTQAAPPLQVPNQLSWLGHGELGPITYATLDQGAEDRSRNVLFVVAILLGTAVACLVAALQVLIKAAKR